ncbi:MAG: oxygen-dependent coproporphyrinogen oxidase [Paracoccaceae bacterium]|jgi:coproporphyrinogen III oxidase|nr:MAG: coproporphyrinogen III oxidase [Rhodobacter sp. BACL10 MAG-120419-bin15]MDP5332204.1 oxygen-dependent coproporphyrinogen oxidase [Paracoccaceae bacterium]MDP5353804.1 oxygen-dependent coproporphyrinogen oxidase [Paracoccaceae bacterium]NQV68158.1 oxygen-dependent coproporphyrinogen oxidase [Paracoccaceae bacterium]HAG25384.1 oxygen-dependent coproporphyrinogen oxidase [Rhodobacter sp.]
MSDAMQSEKIQASKWFAKLRDQIVAAFETLEDSHDSQTQLAGRFEATPTTRQSGGGGVMSVMRGGRVFEKVGVNVSTVHGRLGDRAQKSMAARGVPGMAEDPRFWASGISLVAHMQNPHAPAVHMNTRMFWTPSAWWFGGGTDLNPAIEYDPDTVHFHNILKQTCQVHDPSYYAKFKDWADTYFFIPHRGRARGVGGIFYDDLNTGNWHADFDFTKAVGTAFLPAFLPLAKVRKDTPWGPDEKDRQLVHRGLYTEYNLVYDRGTKFGLETGHDASAVLMSLPPVAKWI